MLEIQQAHQPNYSVLALKGRLDAVTAPELDKALQDTENTKQNSIILDMAGVDYVSSAGLRSLLAGTKRQAPKKKKLVICNLVAAVTEVIHVAGFDQIFTIASSLDQAQSLI